MEIRVRKILGISAFYHDAAAAVLIGGDIIAAAQEERFTRKKYDDSFPINSIKFVLSESGLNVSDLDAVVFYDKPFIKFERLLETYYLYAPRGLKSFISAMPVWVGNKIFTRKNIRDGLVSIEPNARNHLPPILFSEHHLSHAASAFYPSPFEEAAILTVDGVGEWATTTICVGKGKDITILKELHFPHSLGLLYSSFTYYCGFKVNSGEYKLMGLAPYGNKGAHFLEYKKKILSNLVDVKDDGSLFLNMEYFSFATDLKMCRDDKWAELFGIPPRGLEGKITQEYMDLSLAAQDVTEEIMLKLSRTARELSGSKKLVMAGGVALNCVANSRILGEKIFEDIWVQPAAGDAGGALGAAYAGYYLNFGGERNLSNNKDSMHGSYLGPSYGDPEIERAARKYDAVFSKYDDENLLVENVATILSSGKVVGWFQGRMEWGPRALGNRSILGDPRDPGMQKRLNYKIKFREGFRPFAPSVIFEDVGEYFETNINSPYMLFVAPVSKKRRKPLPPSSLSLFERLYSPRSDMPVVTHLDYSARLQTVRRGDNERYWKLLNAFKKITGYSVLANTSFNVRGEPIVCSPEDAYRCFMATDMDILVIGNYVFDKSKQVLNREQFARDYELD